MSTVSIAKYLARFDGVGRRRDAPTQPEPALPVDVDALIEAAVARARDEERALALAATECAVAAERCLAEERLAEARRAWAGDEADRLAAALAAAAAALEVAIADKVARILVPFLAEALRRQVVDDLTQTVSTILAGADAPALRLSGPPDLVAALRERLAGHAAAIDCVAADAADVTLVADRDTIIESRLQAWGERLHRALS